MRYRGDVCFNVLLLFVLLGHYQSSVECRVSPTDERLRSDPANDSVPFLGGRGSEAEVSSGQPQEVDR